MKQARLERHMREGDRNHGTVNDFKRGGKDKLMMGRIKMRVVDCL